MQLWQAGLSALAGSDLPERGTDAVAGFFSSLLGSPARLRCDGQSSIHLMVFAARISFQHLSLLRATKKPVRNHT
jgi:hypothetical protein